MEILVSNNKGKMILWASIILTGFILTVNTGVASACAGGACGGGGVVAHVEHIAEDLCSINSSVKLISYAAIGLVLIKIVELVMLFKKNK